MTMTTTEPKVWIGCLACYNGGRLTGDWVDATEAADYVPCRRTEYGSPHEEWWVMDHEGFGGMLTGECSPAEAQQMAEILERVESEIGAGAEAFGAFVDHYGRPSGSEGWDDIATAFENAYEGTHESLVAYVAELGEGSGQIPDDFPYRIDWESEAHDFECEGWYTAPAAGGSVHIFRPV